MNFRGPARRPPRVKGGIPDRIVTLTLGLVSAQWQEEPAACCVFDRIIRIPVLENSPDMGRHRLLQAILRRCDCLISYVYLELRGEEAQILSSVRRPEETDCAGRHRPGHRRLSERAHPGPCRGKSGWFSRPGTVCSAGRFQKSSVSPQRPCPRWRTKPGSPC